MASLQSEKKQFYLALLIIVFGFMGTSFPYPIFAPLFLQPEHYQIVPEHWTIETRTFWLALTLAAYPFGQFMGAPILGALSDVYGRRKILTISLIASLVSCILTGIAISMTHLPMLVICRLIAGFAEGNVGVVRGLVIDLKTIDKRKALGAVDGMAGMGYVLGPFLGGIFSDKTLYSGFSFQLPFYLAAIVAFVATMMTWHFVREPNIKRKIVPAFSFQSFNFISQLKFVLKLPKVGALIIVSCIFTLAVDTFYEFSPVLLVDALSFSPFHIAIVNGFLSFALAFGSGLLAPKLGDFFSHKQIIISATLCFCMSVGAILFTKDFILISALFFITGFFIALATTHYTIQISNFSDDAIQGEVLGAVWGIRTLGDSLICLLGFGLMLNSALLPLVFAVTLAAISILIYLRKYRRGH